MRVGDIIRVYAKGGKPCEGSKKEKEFPLALIVSTKVDLYGNRHTVVFMEKSYNPLGDVGEYRELCESNLMSSGMTEREMIVKAFLFLQKLIRRNEAVGRRLLSALWDVKEIADIHNGLLNTDAPRMGETSPKDVEEAREEQSPHEAVGGRLLSAVRDVKEISCRG